MKRINRRAARILYLAAVLVALALLAACAPSMTPVQETVKETVVVVETQVVEGETVVQEVVVTATPEPAVEAPAAEATSPPTQAPQPTQIAQPTSLPTQEHQPAPTAYAEQRVVELEYPPSMRLGDSDIIRLALIPYGESYQVTTDFGNHQTDTNPIDVQRPAGYELEAEARLDGVGFEIAPSEDWAQTLPVGEQVTWRWSLTPRSPGQQRLTVTLILRWVPQAETAGNPREATAFSRGLM